MARPRSKGPTPGQLEVLKYIWEHGPCTVRDAMTALNKQRPRAYTTVMTLMNVMAEKGLLRRKPKGRAFTYEAGATRVKTQSRMLKDLVSRVFDGSASALVARLLEQTEPTNEELDEIRRIISDVAKNRGGG